MLHQKTIGFIGELHPRLQQNYDLPRAPIVFELSAQALQHKALPKFVEVSKFPPVRRDLALVVNTQQTLQTILNVLQSTSQRHSVVQGVHLFDQYVDKNADKNSISTLSANEKSLAFRVILQHPERTLEENEVEAVMADLLASAQTHCGARLR
jgi:phenylalanyl-tRNA synthetase beta chain